MHYREKHTTAVFNVCHVVQCTICTFYPHKSGGCHYVHCINTCEQKTTKHKGSGSYLIQQTIISFWAQLVTLSLHINIELKCLRPTHFSIFHYSHVLPIPFICFFATFFCLVWTWCDGEKFCKT